MSYKNCRLCPRACGVNRRKSGEEKPLGFCGQTDQLKVAYVGPHFGEEPPITGTKGSGTVFFSGCSLGCTFCQNHQISHAGMGRKLSPAELLEVIELMIRRYHVHNINFVTPDHFFLSLFQIISHLRKKNIYLPVVYNLSGYQAVTMLRIASDSADIYLPDFKFGNSSLAEKLSKCSDYPQVAIEAIEEMVKQKGFLDASTTKSDLATTGVLVRHLVLPGYVENSTDALTMLFLEFGPQLPVSLMSQYHPSVQHEDRNLNRFLSTEEFDKVYSHAMELGFEHLYVQFPEKTPHQMPSVSPFLPDFRRRKPFRQ
jgi:putative pyruvate formate lyase activating enzyme